MLYSWNAPFPRKSSDNIQFMTKLASNRPQLIQKKIDTSTHAKYKCQLRELQSVTDTTCCVWCVPALPPRIVSSTSTTLCPSAILAPAKGVGLPIVSIVRMARS